MFIIGVTGISCCGKTTYSKLLAEKLGESNCLLISMDNYYKTLTPEQYKTLYDDDSDIDFDVPDAVDLEMLHKHLSDIKNGVSIQIPDLDLGSMTISRYIDVPSNKYKYVILEGVMIFCKPEIAKLCDLKIWIETSDYVCALRRLIKYTVDIKGYSPQYVYNQCIKFVIPGQEKYVKPCKSLCDMFINGDKMEKNVEIVMNYLISS